jgi:hypothetical protein
MPCWPNATQKPVKAVPKTAAEIQKSDPLEKILKPEPGPQAKCLSWQITIIVTPLHAYIINNKRRNL